MTEGVPDIQGVKLGMLFFQIVFVLLLIPFCYIFGIKPVVLFLMAALVVVSLWRLKVCIIDNPGENQAFPQVCFTLIEIVIYCCTLLAGVVIFINTISSE